MSPERWQRMKHVFDQATGLSGELRQTLLSAECAGDLALRAEVERLLKLHESESAIIDRLQPDLARLV